MKKICLVIHSLGIGGMERVMALLANHFAKEKKADVHLILIGIKRKVEYPLVDSITVHRPPFKFNNKWRKLNTIRTMNYLRGTVKKLKPDVILSFGEIWNNLVLLSLYGLKVPVYVSDRSQPNKNLGSLHNFWRNTLYPHASGYIAQTEAAAMICISKGWNRNVKVIGNPVRNVEIDDSIKRENIVLFVGRLIPTKNVNQLIRMFAEIGNPDWKLYIVGGDSKKMNLSEELGKLIRDLDVQDTVFLEGEQKDVDTYYNKSKIFAFTSSSEGYPNVICEALWSGLPVIAYDCVAGPSDIIENGENGFIVQLFDENEFKKKLQTLMQNETIRQELSIKALKIRENENNFCDDFYNFFLKKWKK